jgi:4-amino-4-deoxy-L-arabinose transferase-like glycosyltransferase
MNNLPIPSKNQKTVLEILLLIFCGSIIFLPRLHELPYKGEEPRRVICAQELLLSGNLFVPTIQSELFLSRPPFQNWIIALTGKMLGNFGHLAGRLPSFLSVIATTLLIYFYCRTFFHGIVPILAGLLFLSTFHILKYGGIAETEMLFTFLLAGSYFIWHIAEYKGYPNTLKWIIVYLFLACATLTKGFTQAPLYFYAIIGLSLFLNKRLSNLFTWGHVIGLTIYLGLFGIWQIGFSYYTTWEATQTMCLGDVAMRFEQKGIATYLEHWSIYPLEQFAVLLPWSIFLLAFLSSDFRNRLKPFPAPVTFCLGAIAITFISVWLPVGAKTRYYMPMIPCFVILSAVVIEQCRHYMRETVKKRDSWVKLWTFFQKTFIITVYFLAPVCCIWALFATFILNVSLGDGGGGVHNIVKMSYSVFPIHPITSIIFLIASIPFFVVTTWINRKKNQNGFVVNIVIFVLFTAIIYNLLFIDILKTKYEDVGSHVADLFEKIPVNTEFCSVGHAAFPFIYYYMFHTERILPITESPTKLSTGQYFCISESEYLQWNPENVEIIKKFNTNRFKSEYSKEKNNQTIIGKVIVPDSL